MGGILKNKTESNQSISESTKEFREQVLKNTKLNAQLNETHQDIRTTDIANDAIKEEERLKWNSQNLSENEVIQKNIMENLTQTIDEPKTPFQHATLPEMNEYYQDDDEEVGDLENFSLGEPEFDTLHNEQSRSEDEEQDEEPPKPKKSFAELRKAHYHHEHPPAPQEKLIDQEEDEIDDSGEPPKPKKSFAELRKEHYKNEHAPK